MKETGVIRRIDELGRIVVPKEIRSRLKINSGDQIDISISNNNIILNKYDPLDDDLKEIEALLRTVNLTLGLNLVLGGTNSVILSYDKDINQTFDIKESFTQRVKDAGGFEFSKDTYLEISSNYINNKNGYVLKIADDYDYFGFIMLLSDKIITKSNIEILKLVRDFVLNIR